MSMYREGKKWNEIIWSLKVFCWRRASLRGVTVELLRLALKVFHLFIFSI